jgi:hypothetical protein
MYSSIGWLPPNIMPPPLPQGVCDSGVEDCALTSVAPAKTDTTTNPITAKAIPKITNVFFIELPPNV